MAEVLAMRTILLNFMLKVREGRPIPEAAGKKLIEWADANEMLHLFGPASAEGGQIRGSPAWDGDAERNLASGESRICQRRADTGQPSVGW